MYAIKIDEVPERMEPCKLRYKVNMSKYHIIDQFELDTPQIKYPTSEFPE